MLKNTFVEIQRHFIPILVSWQNFDTIADILLTGCIDKNLNKMAEFVLYKRYKGSF